MGTMLEGFGSCGMAILYTNVVHWHKSETFFPLFGHTLASTFLLYFSSRSFGLSDTTPFPTDVMPSHVWEDEERSHV